MIVIVQTEVVGAEIGGESFICCDVVSIVKLRIGLLGVTYERALVFLLLRLSLLTRFFLHLALILSAD